MIQEANRFSVVSNQIEQWRKHRARINGPVFRNRIGLLNLSISESENIAYIYKLYEVPYHRLTRYLLKTGSDSADPGAILSGSRKWVIRVRQSDRP